MVLLFMIKEDIYFMRKALKEAQKAYEIDEVPVGAVLVDENGKIVAKGYNKKETKEDVTSHAEIEAIRKASKKTNNRRLNNLTLYVTVEPCLMCAGAIISSRIKRVVFGAYEEHTGALLSRIYAHNLENSSIEVVGGILEEESKKLIQKFFKEKRK